DDAASVRRGERLADLNPDHRSHLWVANAPMSVHELLERRAGNVLRDNITFSRVGARVVEDFENVLVSQLGNGLRFALESQLGRGLFGEMGMEDFDRDL